jgi:hypothetical protein
MPIWIPIGKRVDEGTTMMKANGADKRTIERAENIYDLARREGEPDADPTYILALALSLAISDNCPRQPVPTERYLAAKLDMVNMLARGSVDTQVA